MFVLIVDNFGTEYVGKNHLDHLRQFLTKHYTITEDLAKKNRASTWNGPTQKNTWTENDGYTWKATFAKLLLQYGH